MNGRKIKRSNPWEQDYLTGWRKFYRSQGRTGGVRFTKLQANRRDRRLAKNQVRGDLERFSISCRTSAAHDTSLDW